MEGGNPWASASDDIFKASTGAKVEKDVPVVKTTKKNKNGKKKQAPPAQTAHKESADKVMKVEEEEKVFQTSKAVKVPESKEIKPSTEEGFTGAPETWFDDKSFKKDLIADFTHKEGGDYYFDSYSNFYIHE